MSTALTLIEQLAREELVDMVPYQSARRLFSHGNANSNDASDNAEQTTSTLKRKVWLNANEAPGKGEYQLAVKTSIVILIFNRIIYSMLIAIIVALNAHKY